MNPLAIGMTKFKVGYRGDLTTEGAATCIAIACIYEDKSSLFHASGIHQGCPEFDEFVGDLCDEVPGDERGQLPIVMVGADNSERGHVVEVRKARMHAVDTLKRHGFTRQLLNWCDPPCESQGVTVFPQLNKIEIVNHIRKDASKDTSDWSIELVLRPRSTE